MQRGSALYLVSHRMTISTNIHFSLCLLYRAIYPVPAVQIFHIQNGGNVSNPTGLSLCILPRKCESSPMTPLRAKNRRQKSANPVLFSVCPQGQTPPPPGVATDKCIRTRQRYRKGSEVGAKGQEVFGVQRI